LKNKRVTLVRNKEYVFLKQVLSRKNDHIEALEILGDLYTRSGYVESGYAVDKHLVHFQPFNPVHYYNLACDCALLGRKDEAIIYLKIAVILGFDDLNHIRKDPDLASLRGNQKYEKFIREISSGRVKYK